MNYAMQEKVRDGECIDVSKCPMEGEYYILDRVVDGSDYCHLPSFRWIWSIGQRMTDGKILASFTSDLYQRPGFNCLWLR